MGADPDRIGLKWQEGMEPRRKGRRKRVRMARPRRIVPPHTPYVDLRYRDVLRLSLAYQGGVVSWVAFWALYGQGIGAENLAQVASFGAAYLAVVLVEPLIDLAVLAAAKAWHGGGESLLLQRRLFAGRV